MKVFLDSNVICRDYWFRSPAYREFLDGLDVVPAELLISQVVLDEVTNRFREDLEAAAQKLVQAQRQLGRLRPESGDTYSPPDSMTESTAYREWLDGRLADVGCEVTPYPDIPHEKVVKRDLSRRKPFSTKGTGYRDFLIWEGLRRKMILDVGRAVFVTDNSRDFGEGPEIHDELGEDITNPNRLILVNSIRAFNDEFITPLLATLDGLRLELEGAGAGALDLRAWLQSHLLDLLRDEDLGYLAVGLIHESGTILPRNIVSLSGLSVHQVRESPSGEKIVRFAVGVGVTVSFDFGWDDYVRYEEVRDIVSGAEEFSFVSWDEECELDLVIELTLDSDGRRVVGQELVVAKGPGGEFEC